MPSIQTARLLAAAVAITCLSSAPAGATTLRTLITGETAGGTTPVLFDVIFDPTVKDSAIIARTIATGFGVDGIDFVPGTGDGEVVVGAPGGKIAHFDVSPPGGALADFIVDTDIVAVPPGSPGTHPSTVLSTPTHFYYVENQFGFGGTVSHRIMRKPFAGGAEEVVFDGAAAGAAITPPGGAPTATINYEGLEIVDGRLYFFARDPVDPGKRALLSIALDGSGVWDGLAPPAVELTGLAQTPGGTDGSDELDFDPVFGVLFGTNIYNGEVVALDLSGGASGIASGVFIDATTIAAAALLDPRDGLGLLAGFVDGIRSDGMGHLVFVGRAGVMGAIDIAGVKADGADSGDITRLFESTSVIFDDLTPFSVPVPEPSSLALASLLLGLASRHFGGRDARR